MAKSDLNHVTLIGRITRDVGSDERSFGYLPNGNARATVSIAVNRSKKEGDNWVEEANFFEVTVWGRMAEGLKPYLLKGQQIAVEGYLKQDRWEKDGQKMSRVTIVADNIQLLGTRAQNDGANPSGGYAPRYQNNGFQQNSMMNQDYSGSSGMGQSGQFMQNNNPPAQNPFDSGFGGGMDDSFPDNIPF